MRLFDFLHTYFGFNKRERNGILILFGILVLLFIVKISITSFIKEGEPISLIKLSPKNRESENSYINNYQTKKIKKKRKLN